MRRRFAQVAVGIGAAFYLLPGLWAFLDPRSFAEKTESAPPTHLVHDMGAFMVGLGLWAIASLIFSDTLVAALTSLAIVSAIDSFVHFEDLHMGHIRPSEPWILAGMAVLQILGLIAYRSARPRESATVDADRVSIGNS